MKTLKIVSILMSLTFITGCDNCGDEFLTKLSRGFKNESKECLDSSTTSSSPITISVTKPTSSRTLWVDDETSKRTLSFTHTGDTVQCSRDGGSTFGSCDSSSTLVWTTSDYNQQHIIKVTDSSGQSETYTLTPSTEYPGVSFVSCDSEETGTNSEFDPFTAAHLGVASKVICVSDGVTVTNSVAIGDTVMSFGANNITVIAREGQTATFTSTRNSGSSDQQSVFLASGRTGIKLVGLTLNANSGGSSWHVKADSSSEDVQILDCNLTNSTATGAFYSVYVSGSSGNTTPVVVNRSTITVDNAKTALFVSSGTGNLLNSTVSTKYRGVHISIGATSTVTDSTITCADTDTSDYPIYNFRGTLNISGSTVNDGCGNGAIVINDNNFSATVANIESTILKRTTNATGNTTAALVALNGGSSNSFNSSSNQNRICNEAGSTEDFTAVSTGTFAGTWSDGNQLNGGVLADCP